MSTAITTGYDLGQWGYMGIGPTPNKGFELTVELKSNAQNYYQWDCGSGWSKLGILIYDPSAPTKYAIHKTAYLTVYHTASYSTYYMIAGNYYEPAVSSQTVEIDYNPNNWDFYGGFTAADFANKAICFFVKDPSNTTGTAPNGTDFASVSQTVLDSYCDFTYELLQERMANTIDGCNIYAKRAECDKDGEQIDTTYLKKANLQYFVGRNLHYNQLDKIQTNLPGGTADAPTAQSNNFTRLTDLSFAGAYCVACRHNAYDKYDIAISYNSSGTSSSYSFIGTETVIASDNTMTVNSAAYIGESALYTPTTRMGGSRATVFDPTVHKAIIYEGIGLIGPLSKCTIAIWSDNGTVKLALTAIEVGKVGATN